MLAFSDAHDDPRANYCFPADWSAASAFAEQTKAFRWSPRDSVPWAATPVDGAIIHFGYIETAASSVSFLYTGVLRRGCGSTSRSSGFEASVFYISSLAPKIIDTNARAERAASSSAAETLVNIRACSLRKQRGTTQRRARKESQRAAAEHSSD